MKRRRRLRAFALPALSLVCLPALSGCSNPAPAGQVIATIDGENVTKRDIVSELQANGLPVDATVETRDQIVERVIRRKLLAAAAHRRGIDRTPEYLAAVRRSRDMVLVEALSNALIADEGSPSPRQIASFIAARPWMFADRQLFVIDHLKPDRPGGGMTLPKGPVSLVAPGSLDAVAAALVAEGRAYHRTSMAVDSDDFTGGDADRLARAKLGVPLVVGASFVAVTFRAPAPVEGAAAEAKASEALRRMAIVRKTESLLAEQRKSAAIRYQKGYGPSSGTIGRPD